MSNDDKEHTPPPDPPPSRQPLKPDTPVFDLVEKAHKQDGLETKDMKPGEKK